MLVWLVQWSNHPTAFVTFAFKYFFPNSVYMKGTRNKRTALAHEGEKETGRGNMFSRISKINCISPSAGILHKGNGENVFLSQQPPVISTVMGNGFYRSVPCGPTCSGAARDMMLFAPVALASGPDGSLYVGDFNFIRRVHPDGYTRTILELK